MHYTGPLDHLQLEEVLEEGGHLPLLLWIYFQLKETETEKQGYKKRQTDTKRETESGKDNDTKIQTERQRHIDKVTERDRDPQTKVQETDRGRQRPIDKDTKKDASIFRQRQRDKEKDKEKDKRDRERETETEKERQREREKQRVAKTTETVRQRDHCYDCMYKVGLGDIKNYV